MRLAAVDARRIFGRLVGRRALAALYTPGRRAPSPHLAPLLLRRAELAAARERARQDQAHFVP